MTTVFLGSLVSRFSSAKAGREGLWRILPRAGLAVLFMAVCSACAAEPGGEWPKNGSFERGDAVPADWVLDPAVTSKGSIGIGTERVQSGSHGLVLSPNAENTPGPQRLGIGQLVPPDAFRGERIAISAWMAGQGGAVPVVGLHALRSDGSSAGSVLLRPEVQDGKLQRYEADLDVTISSDIANLIVFVIAEGLEGTAYVDDVVIAEAGAGPSSAAPPAGGGSKAADGKASISVDVAGMVRRVPPTLFGTNVEWIFNGNGIWVPGKNTFEPDILRLTKDLGVTLIRFPGGVFSDYYDWRDGVGPQSERKKTPHLPGDKSGGSRHTFGTDELLALADQVGADVLITVNAGNGTPELAADWVRYVNGENGDSPRSHRVKYWEVGNELYMEGDLSGGEMSPEEYAETFLAFARAMRAVDPNIKLGAVGLKNFGRYRFNAHDDWNEVVLREAGSEIDFMAIHNAYSPVVGDKSLDPEQVYRAAMAAPVMVERNLRDTVAQIDRLVPGRGGEIGIGVTEWGPLYALSPQSKWVDHVKTLGSALYVSGALNAFLRVPGVDLANFFKLTEYGFMGWIGKRGNGYAPTAPYLAFQLYSRHFGDVLVPTSVQAPTYDSEGAGLMEAVSDVPMLDGVASRSESGDRAYLIVVNRSLESAIDAEIDVSGFGEGFSGTARVLSGPAVDANTGTELPRIPGLDWAKQAVAGSKGRFDRGGPGEVGVETVDLGSLDAQFTHSFPPLSVTAIELVRR